MASVIRINPRLLASVQEEPKKMLQPITRYASEPLVSLQEACAPLKLLFDEELNRNIQISQINANADNNELTMDESAAIHLYTMEWNGPGQSLYSVLNRTLREADRNALVPWHKFLKLFLTAYFKLPSTEERTIWRGVQQDLSSQYPVDKEQVWWAFSSCTRSVKLLESPSYLGKTGARTLFSIETSSGRQIRAHSYFENEDEILLPPGTYLKVIDQLNSDDGLRIIHLREVAPPFPLLTPPFDISKVPLPGFVVKPSSSASTVLEVTKHLEKATISPPEMILKGHNQFAESGSYKPLYCKGRACVSCGKCRDWYYAGDAQSWQWIRNVANWKDADRKRYYRERVYKNFKRRDESICRFDHRRVYVRFNYGFFRDRDLDDSRGFDKLCLCSENIER